MARGAISESLDRISGAFAKLQIPKPEVEILINLAPADLPKEGPVFDLPIALGYLLASGDIEADVKKRLFVGELSLDGELRSIKGALPITQKAKQKGFTEIFLPSSNAEEAAAVSGITVCGADTLLDVIRHINTKKQDESDDASP